MVVEYTIPILELIEPFVEIINIILAAVIIFFGLKAMRVLEGELKNAWKYFLVAILLFGVHELFEILRVFDIFIIGGLSDLTEFFFIWAFLVAVYIFQKLFIQLSGSSNGDNK